MDAQVHSKLDKLNKFIHELILLAFCLKSPNPCDDGLWSVCQDQLDCIVYGLWELRILMGPLIVGKDAIDEFVEKSDQFIFGLSLDKEQVDISRFKDKVGKLEDFIQ